MEESRAEKRDLESVILLSSDQAAPEAPPTLGVQLYASVNTLCLNQFGWGFLSLGNQKSAPSNSNLLLH